MGLKEFSLQDWVKIDVIANLTPESLAEAFWCMNDSEMRMFFNRLGRITDVLSNPALEYQFISLARLNCGKDALTDAGKQVIIEFGKIEEYLNGDDHA